MHMADAMVSPAVGGVMWAVSAAGIAYCSRKIKKDLDDSHVPLMGVLGAFVFAAQMINFAIPATGSSGHIGGGLLLAVLLGPHAAFLVIASVLVVQALFFADGGLLALGCNIFNLGFFPAFIAYPFIYRKIIGENITETRLASAVILSAVIGLQLGALSVVLETKASGITELPFLTFLALMQPIHLAIGVIEGIATAAVVSFVWKASPLILDRSPTKAAAGRVPAKIVIAVLLAAAVITAGFFSRHASGNPDGLEWATARITGKEELESIGNFHHLLASIQEKISLFPGYALRPSGNAAAQEHFSEEAGTSFSGIVGGSATLALVLLLGFSLKRITGKHPSQLRGKTGHG